MRDEKPGHAGPAGEVTGGESAEVSPAGEAATDSATRELLARMDARARGAIRQLVTRRHVRIEAHAPSHKARVFYVGEEGFEVDISDCVKSAEVSLRVGEPVTARLECFAALDGNLDGRLLLRESETPRTLTGEPAPRPATDKTLEQYLRHALEHGVIDHALRAHVDERGRITFYIHPANAGGETCDYQVSGNLTRPDPRVLHADTLTHR